MRQSCINKLDENNYHRIFIKMISLMNMFIEI